AQGRAIGGVGRCVTAARAFREEDRAFMLALAAQAALALERSRVYERLQRELHERTLLERRYRALVEHLPSAVFIFIDALGVPGTALYMSPNVEKVLGFAPAMWREDAGLYRRQLHPEDRERVLAGVLRARAGGERFSGEYRMLARDGRTVWLHDEAEVIRDEAGRPQFVQG